MLNDKLTVLNESKHDYSPFEQMANGRRRLVQGVQSRH